MSAHPGALGRPDPRAVLEAGEAALARQFAEGVPVAELLRRRTALIDRILVDLWPGEIPASLLATGGYGRSELFPRSDVDLLVLVAAEPDATLAARLAALKAALWDLGLRPGWAVRTPAQTLELARCDVSTATALFESRRIAGQSGPAEALARGLEEPGLWPPPEYLRAKVEERAHRHRRFHDTAYDLEPNLKDGPGGLRDLQTLEWIVQRLFGAGGLERMLAVGELSAEELGALRAAKESLARIRYALHLLTGRAEERLLFDHQRELARRFGFRDEHAENLAVEQFMQVYYRAAHTVERLGEILLERFAERIDAGEASAPVRLSLDFRRLGARIELADPHAFERRPAALVELFRTLAEQGTGVGLAAATARALASALAVAAPRLAEDPAALRAFVEILRRPGAVFRSLSAMHRHDVLGAVLPAFARVTGRMQYDLFHAYTVDQHTLFVLRELDELFRPARPGRRALAEAVAAQVRRPELLYLAALFHDIAKGRGGDHSELGAEEARAFAARIGLAASDAELVAWLVHAHLLMSRTAQREDVQDPQVIERFAAAVGHRERLDLLYLLTVADIAATHPKLWNDWKGQLLATLYESTRLLLRRSTGFSLTADERGAERRREALALLSGEGIAPEAAAALWREFPEDAFRRYEADQIAWQTRCLAGWDRSGPLAAARNPEGRGATEIFVVCPDMDGLFAALTATLDRLELDVLAARIATTASGLAFDTFLVHERGGGAVSAEERLRSIPAALARALAERPLKTAPVRRVLPRRQRHFARAPRIEFARRGERTEMLLVCTDRPGLLAAVAAVFRDLSIRVHEARIATLGERAEDIFLLGGGDDRPLDPERCEALAGRLAERLSAQWRESGGGGETPSSL